MLYDTGLNTCLKLVVKNSTSNKFTDSRSFQTFPDEFQDNGYEFLINLFSLLNSQYLGCSR